MNRQVNTHRHSLHALVLLTTLVASCVAHAQPLEPSRTNLNVQKKDCKIWVIYRDELLAADYKALVNGYKKEVLPTERILEDLQEYRDQISDDIGGLQWRRAADALLTTIKMGADMIPTPGRIASLTSLAKAVKHVTEKALAGGVKAMVKKSGKHMAKAKKKRVRGIIKRAVSFMHSELFKSMIKETGKAALNELTMGITGVIETGEKLGERQEDNVQTQRSLKHQLIRLEDRLSRYVSAVKQYDHQFWAMNKVRDAIDATCGHEGRDRSEATSPKQRTTPINAGSTRPNTQRVPLGCEGPWQWGCVPCRCRKNTNGSMKYDINTDAGAAGIRRCQRSSG